MNHEVENQEKQLVEKPMYLQLALPISILAAALIISGTLLYTRGPEGGTAKVVQNENNVKLELKNGDHILGNKDAKATVVVFADFRCPFCQRFYQQVEQQLVKDYVDTGKVKFVSKNYAFLGQPSVWASEAVECAADQNKYWEYYNWLFTNQAPESNINFYSKENLIKYATQLGLNRNQFAECLNSDKYQKKVADDLAFGGSLGITGTPTAIVIKGNNFTHDVDFVKSQLQLGKYVVPMDNGNTFIVGAQPYSVFKEALTKAGLK